MTTTTTSMEATRKFKLRTDPSLVAYTIRSPKQQHRRAVILVIAFAVGIAIDSVVLLLGLEHN